MSVKKKLNRFLLIVILLIFFVSSMLLELPEDEDVDNLVRSSSLREVTTEDGQRTDYYDEDGCFVFAADKHYATVIKTHGDSYLLEEYYDEHGNPTEQASGHCALLREYDDLGRNYRVTYLGLDGNPMLIRSGYAIVERTFNQDNKAEWEAYLDTEGNPVKTRSLGYGRHNEYENGRNVLVTYLDENKNPMVTQLGYAILRRTFYETDPWTGKVENEFYFDESDKPVALSLGQFGVHKEYDELGRNNILTYLDTNGKSIVTKAGYTTAKRTFYPDDTVKTEMYYDLDGNPVALSQGQYGILKENGATVFLDINGNPQFNLKNWLYANPISVVVIALVVVVASVLAGRRMNAVLLVLYIAFIIYMTLMYRPDGESRAELELFWSYKQFFSSPSLRLEILNNIWLFIPLGAILYKLWPKACMLLIPVLLSIIIEAIQYFTGLGLCELDDVISNGLGGALGFGFGYALEPVVSRIKKNCCKGTPNENNI